MKQISIKNAITEKISGEWGDEAGEEEGVVVIRTANFLNTGKINFSKLVRRKIDYKKVEKKKLITGDIIIEKSGGSPTQPVGRVVYFENPDGDTYLCNNFTTILRPDKTKVHPEFLFHVLHNNHKKGKTLRFQNKTTGIINLKLDSYLDSEIQLPPLHEQIRAAHLLGKVEALIAQRKQHLQQLDDLLKSVFLKMFGDPVRNEKGWTITSLAQHGSFKNGLNFGKGESGASIRYLGVGDFKSKAKLDDFENLSFIELNEPPTADYFLQDHDLLFVRSNGNKALVGRCMAVYPGAEKATYSGFCIRYRINNADLQPIFIAYLFRSTAFRRVLFQGGQGANIQNINQKILSSLPIPVPSKDLQKQFINIVDKVEFLKSRYQASLIDLDQLYGELSQKIFKDGVDLSGVNLSR